MIRSNFKYPPAAASVMEKTTSYLATFADEEEEGTAVWRVEGGGEGGREGEGGLEGREGMGEIERVHSASS